VSGRRGRLFGFACAAGVAVQSLGCRLGPSQQAPRTGAPADPRTGLFELRSLPDRPPISLVARAGDPHGAVALATAHDLGSEASVGVATLLEARLEAKGFPGAESRAHALGFEVFTLVSGPAEASRFVQVAAGALRTPLSQREPGLATVRTKLNLLRGRALATTSEAAVVACSGELGAPTTPFADPTSAEGVARLEAVRKRVASTQAAAFAAVGPAALLDAAAQALAETNPWPALSAPADPWPESDVVDVSRSPTRPMRASLALRVGDAAAVLDAARTLGRPSAALGARLSALEPAWNVERIVGTARPRGGCLRVDLASSDASSSDVNAAARAAAVVAEEAELAIALGATERWAIDESVVLSSDPRQAAGAAAWRPLVARLKPGKNRRFLNVSLPAHDANAGAALRAAFERATAQRSTIEERVRVEAGQGELWALLASPCGTLGESRHDAGLGALVVHALSRQADALDYDVTVEPWVTPDGLGLLAHAPRRSPAESSATQAERVGAALGRLLAAARVEGAAFAEARARLLESVGPGPRPGLWVALNTVSSDHPSWLEPRGSFEALSEASGYAADARRRALVHGPLRLAVLANGGPEQSAALVRGAGRFLRPLRGEPARCPLAPRRTAKRAELTIEASEVDPEDAQAYLTLELASGQGSTSAEARALTYLMNRSGGWLEQALHKPNLSASARARVVGATNASAIVIEVQALDGRVKDAVAELKRLLERLSRGSVSEPELAAARSIFEREELEAQLEPRRRVVDLWRGTRSRALDGAALRKLIRGIRADTMTLVYVKRRE
jgi:hypothetical protein